MVANLLLVVSFLSFAFGLFVFFAGSQKGTIAGILIAVGAALSAISIKVTHALVNVFLDIADSVIDLNHRYDYSE